MLISTDRLIGRDSELKPLARESEAELAMQLNKQKSRRLITSDQVVWVVELASWYGRQAKST